MADAVDIDRPVVKWGNSYGIRLTQADMQRLGIRPGQHVKGRLRTATVRNDLDKVKFLKLGLPSDPEALEELLDSDIVEREAA